jgi:hypothetical protein
MKSPLARLMMPMSLKDSARPIATRADTEAVAKIPNPWSTTNAKSME